MAAEQVQLTGKAVEKSFQNTIRVLFRAGLRGNPGRYLFGCRSLPLCVPKLHYIALVRFPINLCTLSGGRYVLSACMASHVTIDVGENSDKATDSVKCE